MTIYCLKGNEPEETMKTEQYCACKGSSMANKSNLIVYVRLLFHRSLTASEFQIPSFIEVHHLDNIICCETTTTVGGKRS